MPRTRKKFTEAASRETMKPLNVWLPRGLHRALALVRVAEGIAMNEMVRQALQQWLARRRRAQRRSRS